MTTAPLTRDQQIELMISAAQRHEERMKKWVSDKTVADALRRKDPRFEEVSLYYESGARVRYG